jgi:hypothetical protein
MIEGVLRHYTEMEVDRQYVDSHCQSVVAFAFTKLLGFQLLPRLKAIHAQRLYRPEAGKPDAYPNLTRAARVEGAADRARPARAHAAVLGAREPLRTLRAGHGHPHRRPWLTRSGGW